MKNIKQLIFILAITTMLICTLSVSAAAAMTVSTGDVEAYAGETVTVPVKVSSNVGFVSASIYVEYDDSVLTLTGVQDMSLIDGAAHTTRFTSPYILSWENDTKTSNYISNGTLAELVFTVSSFAEPGDYDITISIPTHGILNSDGSEVDCSLETGVITVLTEECSHDWGDWKKSSSTRHKRSCDLCGEVEYDSHDWDDGEVTEEATEYTTGVLTYTCAVCGATKTEIIPEIPREDVSVEGVTLNQTSATMTVGETLILEATITPSDATDQTITWTSSDTSIITVSSGVVTAIGEGTASITVRTTDGGYTAYCNITVSEQQPSLDSDVTFTIANITGKPGDIVDVEITVDSAAIINSIALYELTYDSSVLTFVGFTDYEEIESKCIFTGGFDEANKVISLALSNKEELSGKICKIRFKINDTAEYGTTTVQMTSVVKCDSTNITSEVKAGTITIMSQLLGDVNGDNTVDISDALKLFQHSMLPNIYPITYVGSLDFNKDGNVDINDALRLFQYSMLPDIYPIS